MELTAERLYLRDSKNTERPFSAWLISVCLHVCIVIALIYSVHPNPSISENNASPVAIESYLVFAPKAQTREPINAVKQPPDTQTTETVKPIEISVEQRAPDAPDISVELPEPALEKIAPLSPPAAPIEPQTVPSAEPLTTETATPLSTSKNKARSPSYSSLSSHQALEAARQYIGQQNNDALNALSEREVKQYNYNQQHPEIKTTPFQTLTEDEKFRKSITTQIDCRNAVNKTIGLLSGITGGTLKCSKLPSLTPYIEKHTQKQDP